MLELSDRSLSEAEKEKRIAAYVEELTAGDDGMDQYAIIDPSVDLEGLTEVFVVTSFDIVE